MLAPGRRRATAGLVGLVTLVAFEAIAVSTAMPVTVTELNGLSAYAWAFTGFGATFLYGTVVSGEWCDREGPRRVTAAALVTFLGGLLVAGCAQDMLMLVAGRALQGLGAGAILVAIYVIVARAYPQDVRPKIFAAMAAAWIIPAMVGPIVAGAFADHLTWRLVYLTIPLLVLPAAWAIWPTLRAVDGPPENAVVRTGRKRLALGTALGVAALQQAGVEGGLWAAVLVPVAAVLLVWSVPRLLPAGAIWLRRGLPAAVAMRGLLAGPFAVVDIFIPLMLVSERGLSTTAAGFSLLGGTLGWAAGSWLQGRQEAGTGVVRMRLVRSGAALLAVGIAWVCFGIYSPAPGWVVGLGWTFAGAGMGMALASINVVALELAPPAGQGAVSASIQISDGVATTLLTCAAGAVFATFHTAAGSDSDVFLAMFGLQLAVALFAVVAAGRMRVDRSPSGSTATAGQAASRA